jgi:hypothetical protein
VGEPVRVAWIASPRAAEAALVLLQEARLAFVALDDSIPRTEHRTAFQEAFREWHGWPKDRFDAIGATTFLVAKIEAEYKAIDQIEIGDAWAEALDLLTDHQKPIAEHINKRGPNLPADRLDDFVSSERPRDAVRKMVAGINKRWKRTAFKIKAEGRNPVRYSVEKSE